MATIFQIVRKVNRLVVEQGLNRAAAKQIIEAFKRVNSVLNLFDLEEKSRDSEVERLILEREEARQRGDWKQADEIRDRLSAMGIAVRDRKMS